MESVYASFLSKLLPTNFGHQRNQISSWKGENSRTQGQFLAVLPFLLRCLHTNESMKLGVLTLLCVLLQNFTQILYGLYKRKLVTPFRSFSPAQLVYCFTSTVNPKNKMDSKLAQHKTRECYDT